MENIIKTYYIQFILSSKISTYINNLLFLLQKFFIINNLSFLQFINDKYDYNIILYLDKYFNKVSRDYSKRSNKRANTIYKYINNTIKPIDIKIEKYLDIGCFDGYNTIQIGKKLNLTKNNIIGIDVESFSGMIIKPISNDFTFINYINSPYNIPLNDNSIDLITLLQVLHHVKHPNKLLNEIIRISKNGTLLFIREHDCYNKKIENLIKLEHLLYGIVIDKTDYNVYIDNIYENYFSKQNLIKKLTELGFIELKYDNYIKKINPTNYYDIIFQLKK
jgi:ubiquinone/menaquinone biosynthesis C-methylase UbiE